MYIQGWQVQGSIIFFPEGKPKVAFSWGLGEATNNQADVLALYQGILLAKEMGFKKLVVIGDSVIIMSHMFHTKVRRILLFLG